MSIIQYLLYRLQTSLFKNISSGTCIIWITIAFTKYISYSKHGMWPKNQKYGSKWLTFQWQTAATVQHLSLIKTVKLSKTTEKYENIDNFQSRNSPNLCNFPSYAPYSTTPSLSTVLFTPWTKFSQHVYFFLQIK